MSNLILTKPQTISTAKKLLVKGTNFLAKQSPIILAGTAIVGVATTAVLATKAGIRANDIVKNLEEEKGDKLELSEKVKETWKVYVPTVISATLTVGAIVASSAISQKRQAALAGLYALSEGALKEYQEKVEKELGPKEAQKIKDGINADHVSTALVPPWSNAVLPQGDVLCFDKMTGRPFISSVQKLKTAEAELNSIMYSGDMCASLNELYSLIDNEHLRECSLGEEIGWNINHPCRLYFTSCLTSDMKPALVMDFVSGNEPTYTYRDI